MAIQNSVPTLFDNSYVPSASTTSVQSRDPLQGWERLPPKGLTVGVHISLAPSELVLLGAVIELAPPGGLWSCTGLVDESARRDCHGEAPRHRGRGIPMQRVRVALEYVQARMATEGRPLLTLTFESDGRGLQSGGAPVRPGLPLASKPRIV